MSPGPASRRISYVIPPPVQDVQRLVLPKFGTDRHGQTTPIIWPLSGDGQALGSSRASLGSLSNLQTSNEATTVSFNGASHPQHRLGISSFALDTSTRLTGRTTPEGILYSGGRDGQILAHELGISLKHRSSPYGVHASANGNVSNWEALTGWSTGGDDDEHEKPAIPTEIPFENAYEIDSTNEIELKFSFRQSVQSHSDWVNDILLCNHNRTLVSCSNDGTVKAWNPHDPSGAMDPHVLGRHADYARCLTTSSHQNWIASGGFDRTINLWDLSSNKQEPFRILVPPEASNSKSSVYAIATDGSGSFIAAGSPEKVIRLWDARSASRIGKLVGHTDNIRSILVSQDGRYLLSASADASIKLWSLASANRCIHTFAHHTDSVWSMFSNHPALSVFYSGDRAGNVCRVDMDGRASLSEGECVLLCKELPSNDSIGNEGINRIQVLDDQLVWTATASSSINCWKVPGIRSNRIDGMTASPGDIESETSPMAPQAESVSPFGFSMDSIQPSLLRARQRESFSTDREGWVRSESPASTSDAPIRRVESPPFGSSPRNIPKSATNPVAMEQSSSVEPSDSSIHTATGQNPQSLPGPLPSMFGIPYQSLIKLASPSNGFTAPLIGRAKDADVSTLYSAASIKSVPIPMRQLTIRTQQQADNSVKTHTPHASLAMRSVIRRSMNSMDGALYGAAISASQFSQRNPAIPLEETEDAARLAYESRDVAADAISVRSRPDFTIQGTQGIVRSVVLNDRWHALTVNTAGHVGVWDIVRGACVGVFEKGDVEEATRSDHANKCTDGQEWKWSPREALEVVRERIEGEAVVQAWCTVDSSIGNLMVHVESPKAFDAEIFADEAGYSGEIAFEEDHRLNIGKWVIGNLFAPFVAHQKLIQSEMDNSTGETLGSLQSPPGLTRTSITRPGGPKQLGLEARRIRSISEMAASQRTPGIMATSTMPKTPALLPDLPSDALTKVAAALSDNEQGTRTSPKDYGALKASPSAGTPVGSPTPKGRSRSQTVDDSTSSHNHDYFSVRRRGSVSGDASTVLSPLSSVDAVSTAVEGDNASTPGASLPSSTPATSPAPITPGGGLGAASTRFMGKFKSFGKPKKPGATEAQDTTAAPSTAEAETEKTKALKPPSPTVLQTILSRPLDLPLFTDVPPIEVNPMTGILISEASPKAASGWAPVYRGLYATQPQNEDLGALEMELPAWILEFLLNNKVGGVVGGGSPAAAQKLGFMIVPWKGSKSTQDLPDLLGKETKLTASRFLRVRKILSYVKEKVETIERSERRPDHERFEGDESNPSAPRSPHSKPPPLGGPGSSPQLPRQRPISSSSSRSGASGQHHASGSSRHRRPSKATIEEEGTGRRAQDLYELLCHEAVLPNNMTLAAVKQFKFKGGPELVMEYRRKK
ncbi:WD repeat-containing protein 48 homolog [Serendipita indica DSM 11827]|nr:WD repeat-containing protein 48 homolog [Serendipita indica DSM 11827]